MKNKQFTQLLMIVVALVWGLIFYRVFAGLTEDAPQELNTPAIPMDNFNMNDHTNDAVHFTLNYRDPFSLSGKVVPDEKIARLSSIINSPVAPSSKKPIVNWQAINYKGYISNAGAKKHVAIILFNGKEFMLSEGATANGIKLIKYAGDSVKLQYMGETKYITIK